MSMKCMEQLADDTPNFQMKEDEISSKTPNNLPVPKICWGH